MTKMSFAKTATAFSFLVSVATFSSANAAEIKVSSSAALRAVLVELAPQFERASGHKLAFQFGPAATMKRQIDAGDAVDVAVLTPVLIDELISRGTVAADTRADIARTGVGVAVRAGAPKPKIATADEFTKSLLAAKSIGYTDPALGGLSGSYTGRLIERLGLAAELKPKTKLAANGHALAEAVAKGEVEIGLNQISELAAESGIELVGPYPPELQLVSVFTAGMLVNSKEPEASRALIKFLVSPAALSVIKAKSMEPG